MDIAESMAPPALPFVKLTAVVPERLSAEMDLAKQRVLAYSAVPRPTPTSAPEFAARTLAWVERWQMAAMSPLPFDVLTVHARNTPRAWATRHLIVAPPLWSAMD